ncbi:related to ATP10 - F1F0 ATPase complex assembly protein [Melanopsichium pennsylvanicum]|uniref:Related to ATP10 - F1F0 ATPase complex assembly protein n=1 Tax=Melanopsichium pennsylvanicum TaxID=63383 RepID=A0AAJ5C610_9BASI|nr:related to ATP10 - F1F0 ATPase complex assembly protein [Melanopsichium pennsylvanicum]
MLRSTLLSAARPAALGSASRTSSLSTGRTLSTSASVLHKDSFTSTSPSSASPTSSGSTCSSKTATSSSNSSASDSTSTSQPAAATSTKPLVRESSTSPEELNSQPLPYLSFALGLPNPPTSAPASWREKRDRLISPEYRLASRKAIVKEATRGYFHDFHAIKSHGGKTWRAPPTLIRSDRSLWFPKISGTRLSDKSKVDTVAMFNNKVSIVALLGSKISEEHTKSFYHHTIHHLSPQSLHFQLVQINLQTNPLKNYLVSLFLSSLRSQIDPSFHHTYLLSNQDIELEKESIGFHNKHVGYTYLVDQKGRIRWAGCGFAEQAEMQALFNCTRVLLDRSRQGEEKSKK